MAAAQTQAQTNITSSLPQGSLRSAISKLDDDIFNSLAASQPGSPSLGATKISTQPEVSSPLSSQPTSQPTSAPAASKPKSPVLSLLMASNPTAQEVAELTTHDAMLLCPHWNIPEHQKHSRRHSHVAHTGPSAIAQTLSEMRQHRKGLKFDVETSFGQGEDVAIFGHVQWESSHLGRRVQMPFAVWAKIDIEGRVEYLQIVGE